ncbi:MAG: hypothetical protein CL908_09985 [Deltaproteobacteria bacterium]|nr:hypothetical protein [Deltaproteobacteria bacterium]
MIKVGCDILFQEPTCDVRRLRRSVVIEASGDEFSIQFAAEPFEVEADQELLMYFDGNREFMQQIGRVKEIIPPDEEQGMGPAFVIEPVGDAISAESRETYRVSTISASLEAHVGEQDGLQVQDLSATGLAVIASEDYQMGQTIGVAIEHDGEKCHGVAAVQSIRELGPGRIRYGLRAIEEDSETAEFLEILQRISLAVQREQLQRSGS